MSRIALIAYACSPTRGSEPGFGWQWTRHLLERGHDVDLVTRDDPDNLADLTAALPSLDAPGRLRLHVVARPALARWRRGRAAPATAGWPGWRQYTGWLDRVDDYAPGSGLGGVDLVHHVTWGSVKGGTALLDLGRPVVLGPVGGGELVPPALMPLLGVRGAAQEYGRQALTRRCLRGRGRPAATLARCDVLLATNSVTRAAARRHGARRVELMLADGLPANYLTSSAGPRDLSSPRLLWVGSLQPRKAPGLALDTFRQVLDRHPGASLRIVGDGPLRGELLRRRDRLGLTGSVRFLGRIPWTKVRDEYDRAAVLLFTSARDAFGGQCLEAWGRGVPSVGFAQFGLADHAPGGGAVIVPAAGAGRPAGRLATAVAEVLDPGRHPGMAEAALRTARRHTWDVKADRISQLYAELLTGRPAARTSSPARVGAPGGTRR